MSNYSHPEVLVSTDWVQQNLDNPSVRLVEVDVENSAYDQGHIRGAVAWSWQTQLSDRLRRDIIPRDEFDRLLSQSGITPDPTGGHYVDNIILFAAWAF